MQDSGAVRTRFDRANPILRVADMARSLEYYVEVLGFRNADWGGDDFTCVSRDGADIYLCEGDQAWEMKVGDPDGHVLRFGSDPEDGDGHVD